jgi:hypothetical protein
VDNLANETQQIMTAAGVIQSIADQTNLLAPMQQLKRPGLVNRIEVLLWSLMKFAPWPVKPANLPNKFRMSLKPLKGF